jgi:hypothetical protein
VRGRSGCMHRGRSALRAEGGAGQRRLGWSDGRPHPIVGRLPPDEGQLPLKLELPEGNLIGLARDRLPVRVSFTGARPISFTAPLEFLDEVGAGGVARGAGRNACVHLSRTLQPSKCRLAR